jgi:predicted PurR-regulated permease PerM
MNPAQRRQLVFWLAVLALTLLVLHLLSGILLPFVAGLAIAYFLDPAVDRLERWGLARGAASGIVLLLFGLVLVTVAMLVVPLLQLQAAELARRLPAVIDQGRNRVQQLAQLAQERLSPEDLARLRDVAGAWAGSVLAWSAQFIEGLVTRGMALANLLSLVFVTPVVAFFLLRDWDRLVARVDAWLPRQHLRTVREQARIVDATLAGFVHGQLLVGLVLGAYYALALSIAGLDFAIILGVLIGILSFVPFVGAAIAFTIALGLALLQLSSWTAVALVVGIFVAGQTLESNVLSPKLVGERVNLHPVWVIFALLAFGSLFGFVGVLLALPAAAVAGVLVRFALAQYLASPLYDPSNRPRADLEP